MIDYHIHPNYSIDAEPVSMADYCFKAVELGLKEICFTTHCEFDVLRKDLDWKVRVRGAIVPMHPTDWLDEYFKEAINCKDTFRKHGLNVRVGLEAGYDLGLDRSIETVINNYPFDFVIGSVHCLDHIAISSQRESSGYFCSKSLERVGDSYFKTLAEAIKSRLFNVIGHLDIYRRHGTKFFGTAIEEIHIRYIANTLQLMVDNETGIELNTSSLKQGQGLFYPGTSIIESAQKSGVKYFTIGSDCHSLEQLGAGVFDAYNYGKKVGINFVVFENRLPINFI